MCCRLPWQISTLLSHLLVDLKTGGQGQSGLSGPHLPGFHSVGRFPGCILAGRLPGLVGNIHNEEEDG